MRLIVLALPALIACSGEVRMARVMNEDDRARAAEWAKTCVAETATHSTTGDGDIEDVPETCQLAAQRLFLGWRLSYCEAVGAEQLSCVPCTEVTELGKFAACNAASAGVPEVSPDIIHVLVKHNIASSEQLDRALTMRQVTSTEEMGK